MLQGTWNFKEAPNPVLIPGRTAIAGANTATPLLSSSTPCQGVLVSADPGAGQIISVGNSTVAAGTGAWKGVILFPGNQPLYIPTDDVSKVYFNSDNAGAFACFTYFV